MVQLQQTNVFLVHYSVDYFLAKMSKNVEKCQSVLTKAKDDVLRCLVLSTAQRHSVYHQRIRKYSHLRSWIQLINHFIIIAGALEYSRFRAKPLGVPPVSGLGGGCYALKSNSR